MVLDCIVPHLKVLYDIAPDNMPTITQCIIKLSLLDATAAPEAETSEAAVHTWLQELSNLAQVQYLYCSPLYSAFLKRRFAHTIQLARQYVGNRVETVRTLLESATIGSLEHVALFLVQTLEDNTTPFIEKLHVLWCTPSAHELVVQWKLRDWMVHLVFLEKSCRNDWEGLDPNTLEKYFSGPRAGDVTPKDIPNVVMMSL